MSKTGTFTNALPIISLYAFAGYRLMPSVQQVYTSITQLRYGGPALDNLYNDIKSLKPLNLENNNKDLSFNKSIKLKDVYYNYPNASRTALKDINIDIFANTKVGLVGATGSGKTTTIDIILGLLNPDKGTLEVDGQIIEKSNLRSWQKLIGYVPQHIYLADDTIESNIALGVESKDINQDILENVSKIANLHDFIIKELPKKYKTVIGERGVRLSGGQRQRIGIARALYHNPKILIFDEATSALDNLTEKIVMQSINKISKDITIVLIAHRLSTVKTCDTIFYLENGVIKNKGTFEELIEKNDKFKMTATGID